MPMTMEERYDHAIAALQAYNRAKGEAERAEIERKEKLLADYREQLNRPFEHEERLRALLARQQEINHQLDLDKGDTQVAANDNVPQDEQATETFVERLAVERRKGRVVETAA
jgi:hypothetical protein